MNYNREEMLKKENISVCECNKELSERGFEQGLLEVGSQKILHPWYLTFSTQN